MDRQELRDLLRRAEIPACACPVFSHEGGRILPPCEHVRSAPDHGLSLDDWAALLCLAWPSRYAERPLPEQPTLVLSRAARVAVYRERCRQKRALRHPQDLDPLHVDHLSRRVGRGRNGAVLTGELLIQDGNHDGVDGRGTGRVEPL